MAIKASPQWTSQTLSTSLLNSSKHPYLQPHRRSWHLPYTQYISPDCTYHTRIVSATALTRTRHEAYDNYQTDYSSLPHAPAHSGRSQGCYERWARRWIAACRRGRADGASGGSRPATAWRSERAASAGTCCTIGRCNTTDRHTHVNNHARRHDHAVAQQIMQNLNISGQKKCMRTGHVMLASPAAAAVPRNSYEIFLMKLYREIHTKSGPGHLELESGPFLMKLY